MIRKIIEIGHPALREIAKAVPKADIASKKIQRLVEDLIAVSYTHLTLPTILLV